MALIHHSFLNIIKFDSYDVHPPFYYLLLKVFLNIFTFWTKSIFVKIIFARLFSLFCLFVGITYLIKLLKIIDMHVNKYIQFIGVIFTPSVMMFSTQIRMYSLGLTLSVLSLYELIFFIKERTFKHLFLAFVFVLMSSYTHYFAGLFVGLLILVLCVYEIYKKQLNVGIKIFILDVILIFMFLPWLLYTLPHLKNTNQINSESLLKKIAIQIIKCIISFCGILNSSLNSNINIYFKILFILFIYVLIFSCYIWSFNNLSYKFNNIIVMNLVVFLLILIIGSIVDVALGFEFSIRFVYPSFFINSFFIIYILSRMPFNYKYLMLIMPILLICTINSYGDIGTNIHNMYYSNYVIRNCNYWKNIRSKNIYITDKVKHRKLNLLNENSFMSHKGFNNTDKATLLFYINKNMLCKKHIIFPISNGNKLGYKVWPNIFYKR